MGCPPPEPTLTPQMKEYAFTMYYLCLSSAVGGKAGATWVRNIVTTPITDTYTFINFNYSPVNMPSAVANGEVVWADDSVTLVTTGTITFTSDILGLKSIAPDFSGPSGGVPPTAGVITINDIDVPVAEFVAWAATLTP